MLRGNTYTRCGPIQVQSNPFTRCDPVQVDVCTDPRAHLVSPFESEAELLQDVGEVAGPEGLHDFDESVAGGGADVNGP